MKNAKFIKNEFYKTLYRASDDTYKYAIISFTSVRYEDKDRDEFVSFNKINDAKSNEVWKEKLAKRVSNYDDFITNIESWKQEGTYKELTDKVKYMEPESISENEFALDNIEQVEITQVLDKDVNLAFIEIYDQNGSKYNMTCDFDNKDIILSQLIVNYEKLCKKGKVNILNKEDNNTNNSKIKITSATFIINNNQVDTYIIYEDEYGKPYLKKTTLERGLNRVDNDKSIKTSYKAIIKGKSTDITREEFDAFVSVINNYNENSKNHTPDDEIIAAANINNDYTNYYGYERQRATKNNKKRVAIFAAAIAFAATGLCYLLSKDNKTNNKTPIRKSTSSSQTDNSNTTATTITTTDSNIITTNNGYVITSSATNNSNTNSNTNTISSTSISTNTNSNTSTNANNTTTGNGYVTVTNPTTAYTGTYRTISPIDTVTSGQTKNTTKTTTKSTTSNVVPSGTVNRSDMVTAGPKPGDQVFTKDGATTTTKKATTTTKSTTSNNPYADLIITREIDDSGKTLVLKK